MRTKRAFFCSSSMVEAPTVAHAGAESADELVDHGFERAAIGDAAFDAFGDEFAEAVGAAVALAVDDALVVVVDVEVVGALEVALAAALGHSRERTHAAIGLEGAALVEDGFAGALVDAGKEGADHDDAGSGGDGFGDVAGILDAAVGDDGDVVLVRGLVRLADGGDLRHARAGDHARGADGAGADADFDGVRAGIDEGFGSLVGGDVAGEEIDLGESAS